MASGLQSDLKPYSKKFIRASVLLARKNHIFGKSIEEDSFAYMWWILMENRKNWPSLSTKEWLGMMFSLNLVSHHGDTILYHDVLKHIGGEMNDAGVDKTIKMLASWNLKNVVTPAMKGLASRSSAYAGNLRASDPERFTSDSLASGFLTYSFMKRVQEKPHEMGVSNPLLLEKLMMAAEA
jgi:hypothetical protein